jgi:hypothetical protein
MVLPPQKTLEFAMWRRREPVISVLAGTDVVLIALLTAANAVGVTGLDGPQLAAVTAAIVTATAFVAALLRALVVSPHTHELEVTDALFSPVPGNESGDV